MISSNGDLALVRDRVRESALSSFEFFANTVLASKLPEELCRDVQDVVNDQEDTLIKTRSPRSLAIALSAWLGSRGVAVLTTVALPKHELLTWLEFNEGEVKVGSDVGVTLDIRVDSLDIKWL